VLRLVSLLQMLASLGAFRVIQVLQMKMVLQYPPVIALQFILLCINAEAIYPG
jgi:hypothetical protein